MKRISTQIQFTPWVGRNYSQGFAGKKILGLGESHHCANLSDATPDITVDVIKGLWDPDAEHEGYMNTYTKFAKAMTGKESLSLEDKKTFWDSIAFYNYVQVPIPAARVAPSANDFAVSERAFFEVLETLRPDLVIAWGSRLYNNLPKGGIQGKDLRAEDGKWIETWQYFLKDGTCVKILPIVHPSAAFSPDYWHKVISLFIYNY